MPTLPVTVAEPGALKVPRFTLVVPLTQLAPPGQSWRVTALAGVAASPTAAVARAAIKIRRISLFLPLPLEQAISLIRQSLINSNRVIAITIF
jgi:hypothetical protein